MHARPSSQHFIYSPINFLCNGIQFQQNRPVVETQNSQSKILQVFTAPLIVFRLREFNVLGAIHLHYQPRRGRIEINDVVADGLLSVELHA